MIYSLWRGKSEQVEIDNSRSCVYFPTMWMMMTSEKSVLGPGSFCFIYAFFSLGGGNAYATINIKAMAGNVTGAIVNGQKPADGRHFSRLT